MPDTIYLQQNNGGMKDMTPQTYMHQTLIDTVPRFDEVQKQEFSIDCSNSITISNGMNNMSTDSNGVVNEDRPFEVDSFEAMFSELYEVDDISNFTDGSSCYYPLTYPSMPSPDTFQMEAFMPWAYQT